MSRLLGWPLRRRLVSLAVVLLVAAGLLAMHQLSVGHAAVVPTDLGVRAAVGHQAPDAVVNDHGFGAADDDHWAGQDDHAGGHDDHGLQVIGCLAAIGLLIMGWLPRPRHRPRARPIIAGGPVPPVNPILTVWHRRTMSLLELEISRT